MGDSERYWIIDQRYLSISITYQESDIEQPNQISAWIFDLSLRPLFSIHIASTWRSLIRCENFTILATSFQSFGYTSDIYETDETRIYPLPNAPSAGHFLAFIWKILILGILKQLSLLEEAILSIWRKMKNRSP